MNQTMSIWTTTQTDLMNMKGAEKIAPGIIVQPSVNGHKNLIYLWVPAKGDQWQLATVMHREDVESLGQYMDR